MVACVRFYNIACRQTYCKKMFDICICICYNNTRAQRIRARAFWGYSSVGRALEWHSRGQGFDSPYLHHLQKMKNTAVCLCVSRYFDAILYLFARFICAPRITGRTRAEQRARAKRLSGRWRGRWTAETERLAQDRDSSLAEVCVPCRRWR